MIWYDQEFAWSFTNAQLWAFLGPVVSGLIAAFVVHWLGRRRDKEKVRQEWLAQKLESAYLLLLEAQEFPGMSQAQALPRKLNLQKAINTIDLYANKETKRIAAEIVESFEKGENWIKYGSLQTALRDELRKNLGLEKLQSPTINIMFAEPSMVPTLESLNIEGDLGSKL